MKFEAKKVIFICLALACTRSLLTICTASVFQNLTETLSLFSKTVWIRETPDIFEEKNILDLRLNPTDMMKRDNYSSETHFVTTEDGYILTLHRIPGKPGSVPVLLQHGLLGFSGGWLIAGKEKSLAYMLSDRGYDVWLGNYRGNTFSKRHKTLSTSDPQFWDFSWHEQGFYDLPAFVTYITQLTNNSLFYVGYSMGATTFSVMAIEKPEVAKNIKAMIGLAPATYVYHTRSPIRLMSSFWKIFQQLANMLGVHEFFPKNYFFDIYAKYICQSTVFRDVFCRNIVFLLGGYSPNQLDYNLLPKIWCAMFSGTSVKLYTHWLQQISVNEFRMFDYGETENLKIYNSSVPPNYDISKIQVPVLLFASKNDWLVAPIDVLHFYEQLQHKLGFYEVNDEQFNHIDFLSGINASDLVYSKVIDVISSYENSVIDY